MSQRSPSAIDLEDLRRRVRAADGDAFLVPSRIVHRVIEFDRLPAGLAFYVPHHDSCVVQRDSLLEVVAPDELGLAAADGLPQRVLLLAEPEGADRGHLTAAESLRRCWQRLFHARIDAEFQKLIDDGHLDDALAQRRIAAIGQTQFDEIRAVLRDEARLLPPRDNVTVYAEFAATYLELRHFAPELLGSYFPAIEDHQQIDRLLAEDVDAPRWLADTRLEGAPHPSGSMAPEGQSPPRKASLITAFRRGATDKNTQTFIGRAERAGKIGNSVRSAILRQRVAKALPRDAASRLLKAARSDLAQLQLRLSRAVPCRASGDDRWADLLLKLLERTQDDTYTVEARLLYDLQKACLAHERRAFTVDAPGWLFSLGRRPLRRPLPYHREVLLVQHLRSAERRLTALSVPAAARDTLSELLHGVREHAEDQMRTRLRGPIVEALDEVELTPANVPERVSRKKLVEELLDRVAARGFINLGDVRDSISRGGLKLPDLHGPGEFLFGDRLLRADKRLASKLDGVYRAGEFYLRWLQRLSSLAYGTSPGRFLTKYVAITFGGAFIILTALQHFVEMFRHHSAAEADAATAEAVTHAATHAGPPLVNVWTVLAVGVLLHLLIHVPSFRRNVVELLWQFGTGVRRLLYEPLMQLVKLPWVKQFLESRPLRVIVNYLLKPGLVWTLVWLLLPEGGPIAHDSWAAGTTVFLALAILINSRPGRDAQERLWAWLGRAWRRIRVQIVSGFLRLVIDFFRGALEAFERVLYAIDERLRFKTGDRRLSLAAKALVSPLWFGVTYVVRAIVALLVEPQVNPIKHFPVVTVAHKVILGFTPHLVSLLAEPFGLARANAIAGAVQLLLPGVAGFFVWELKENWRLYEANRARRLRPVLIGEHGETMLRFVRPGLHSGTLPKLYAKLRRAQRDGNWKKMRRHRDGLKHAAESIGRFIERELFSLLAETSAWQQVPLAVGQIRTGCNSVRIEILLGEHTEPLDLAFQEQSGWLVAAITASGPLAEFDAQQRGTFRNALIGTYKLAGASFVRQQIEAALKPGSPAYDIDDVGLIVWPLEGPYAEMVYPLDRLNEPATLLVPENQYGEQLLDRTLPCETLSFEANPVSWPDWVRTWQEAGLPTLLPQVQILPGGLQRGPALQSIGEERASTQSN